MSKDKLIELSNQHNKKSNWLKDALYRRSNKKWLNYSSQIARRILAKIEDDENQTQAELARTLNVSAQQISKIIKGQENLTLETIAKFSEALQIELITFPDYKYNIEINKNTWAIPTYFKVVSLIAQKDNFAEKYYYELEDENNKSDLNFFVIKKSGVTTETKAAIA